jgi:hypothetical protein
MDWYFATKDVDEVRSILGYMLTGRGSATETREEAAAVAGSSA